MFLFSRSLRPSLARIIALGVGALLTIGMIQAVAVSTVSATPLKTYRTCAALNQDFPFGLSGGRTGTQAALSKGFESPAQNPTLFAVNKSLGAKGATFVCAVRTTGSMREKTSWGYVTAWWIKGPVGKKCVSVPVTIELKNNANINMWGVQLAILDDFGTIYGATQFDWMPDKKLPVGKYNIGVAVCGTARSLLNGQINAVRFQPGENYTLYAIDPIWLTRYAAPMVDIT